VFETNAVKSSSVAESSRSPSANCSRFNESPLSRSVYFFHRSASASAAFHAQKSSTYFVASSSGVSSTRRRSWPSLMDERHPSTATAISRRLELFLRREDAMALNISRPSWLERLSWFPLRSFTAPIDG